MLNLLENNRLSKRQTTPVNRETDAEILCEELFGFVKLLIWKMNNILNLLQFV